MKMVRYETKKECLEALGIDSNTKGYWEWADADGTKHREHYKHAINTLKKRACWGWVENKETIHIWIGKKAKLDEVIEVLAHEIGHAQRPFHRNVFSEETKASKYAQTAVTALNAATELMGEF